MGEGGWGALEKFIFSRFIANEVARDGGFWLRAAVAERRTKQPRGSKASKGVAERQGVLARFSVRAAHTEKLFIKNRILKLKTI